MLADSGLSNKYWAFAAYTAVYLKNRSPTSSLAGKTPHEAMMGHKPSLTHLRGWGCLAFVHGPYERRQKLDLKAQPVIFVCYSASDKLYSTYDPIGKRLIRSRDVIFREDRKYLPPIGNQHDLC
jgi:hypothetical protein